MSNQKIRKGRKIKPKTRVRKVQCETCVFRRECDGGIHLAPGRHAEIEQNLLNGINQLCHHDNDKTVCRGGRDFQLQIFHRLGIIPEPTDAALREAMKKAGVEPGSHV